MTGKPNPYVLDVASLARRLRKAVDDYHAARDSAAPIEDTITAGDALVDVADDLDVWLQDIPDYPDDLRAHGYPYAPRDDRQR